MRKTTMLAGLGTVALLWGGLVAPAAAKNMPVHSRAAKLPTATLAQLCERGLVALIETNPDGTSRQVVLFAHVKASPQRIYDVLMDVERYPSFLNTIDATSVLGRRKGIVGFSWALDLPLFSLKGTRLQRGLRPKLVESRGRTGDLRGTRERWELYPVRRGTLIAFYRALDIETGGMLLRTLVRLEPSAEAGANLSSGFIHLRGVERHLAGQPQAQTLPAARKGPIPDFVPLELEGLLPSLRPLLEHGQLALIESHDDGALRQVALVSLARAPASKYRQVVATPELYPDFIPNISKQRVTRKPDGKMQLDWTIKAPLTTMSGTALMTATANSVEVNAVSGDVDRARIRWEFVPVGDSEVVPVYYSYSDIRSASWVTRQLLKAEPLLEHGMVAAAGTVTLTAMTARAEGRR